ncbi:S4A5 electrogenic sodium bicarbonate cotransporter 4 [Adlercreutzia caecimuris]|uniref:S4A5 electrogenic sodium bicarbonate cotransporter 4 n=1 Tax=Adlercreutzia caecimuris TaxID=671266 RepID=A0A4V3WUL4_9ACTN|nr:S4A5 electrogenic sodium bicarbonate cotransporter 4 [Adlercreutzia caecimuris]NBJ65646.1 S4A5 electrogenic sodium bicarbonate cotransporter 4 [Adlercreutzia caecimuris]THG36327.1 S4A5 electrogenic sodium bicarbonate cotransporter 4 [Adlercreutzia caecimuris]
MAKPHGSVRIGPISLFTLIIILCLAVLAVLSLTTARAELSITERQAQTTTETYALETAGQEFVAAVDAALAEGRSSALDEVLSTYGVTEAAADAEATAGASEAAPAAGETIEDESVSGATADEGGSLMVIECPAGDPVTVTGSFDGSLITATFSLESGRTLAVALRINDNDTYRIEQWKMTTQWTDDGTGENLWLG